MIFRPAVPLLDLVYPRFCTGCAEPVAVGLSHFCWDCLASIHLITHPFCAICGDPVDGKIDRLYTCGWCMKHTPWFDGARSAARYQGALKKALHAFKYGQNTFLASDLSSLMHECAKIHYARECFDAVLYVPLHWSREYVRTYNQAELLARNLGRRLGVPVLREALQRSRSTSTQTALNANKRRGNVAYAFKVRNPGWIQGRRCLLVDDIMTTGATVNECARVLKKAGAVTVHVMTVARG